MLPQQPDNILFIPPHTSSYREATEDDEAPTDNLYTLEFTFDSEARTAITIYFFASEEVHGGHAR